MVGQLDGCGQLVALLEGEVLSKPAIEDEAQLPVEFHNGLGNTHQNLSFTSSKLTEQWASSLLLYLVR